MATATQGPFFAVSEIAGNLLDFGAVSETPNSFGTDFTFEIADKEKHYKIVHDAMCQIFSYQEPITRAVGEIFIFKACKNFKYFQNSYIFEDSQKRKQTLRR